MTQSGVSSYKKRRVQVRLRQGNKYRTSGTGAVATNSKRVGHRLWVTAMVVALPVSTIRRWARRYVWAPVGTRTPARYGGTTVTPRAARSGIATAYCIKSPVKSWAKIAVAITMKTHQICCGMFIEESFR